MEQEEPMSSGGRTEFGIKAVEYGTLLGLQESTDTKKPLGYVEESSLYKASVGRHQPSQRKCHKPN